MGMRYILASVIALSLSGAVVAQTWTTLGFETITAAGTAIGFTATTLEPNGQGNAPQASVGVCRVATAQIRYRVDGPSPTSSVGILAEIGDVISLNSFLVLRNFKAIRTGGTSGVLSCTVGLQ